MSQDRARDPADTRAATGDGPSASAAAALMLEAVQTTDFLLWAGLQRDAAVVASSGPTAVVEGLEPLRLALCDLLADYPRPDLRRVLLEDEQGTVIACRLDPRRSLLVAAGRQANVGSVSVAADRLLPRLRGAGT